MAAISWASGINGDWSTGIDWTGGVVPVLHDQVTIAASGTYTVQVSTSEAAGSLILDEAEATLAIDPAGTLALAGAFTLEAGTADLYGAIDGGVLSATGGTFAWNGGTLDGVTYDGPLTIGGAQTLKVGLSGLTVTGSDGAGPGVIDFTGADGKLQFHGSPTLNDTAINFNGMYGEIDLLDADATLTLGAGVTVDDTGNVQTLNAYPSGTIINEGTILASQASGSSVFEMEGALVVNRGSIITTGGKQFWLGGTGETFENDAGGIVSVSGASSGFTMASTWTNAGTISASGAYVVFNGWSSAPGILDITDSTVELFGAETAADLTPLAGYDNDLGLEAPLDNAGATLSIGTDGDFAGLSVGDITITGGTIVDGGGLVEFAATTPHRNGGNRGGPVLDGVTYEGILDLSNGGTVNVGARGLAMTGADGTGLGEIDLTADDSLLAFTGTQTLDNAVVQIGGDNILKAKVVAAPTIQIGSAKAGGTLILGPDLTVDQTGGATGAVMGGGGAGAVTLINDGIVELTVAAVNFGRLNIATPAFMNNGAVGAEAEGSAIYITSSTITNTGTIGADNGGFIYISSVDFTNLVSGVLTGGAIDVGAASTIDLPTDSIITTLDATIELRRPSTINDPMRDVA